MVLLWILTERQQHFLKMLLRGVKRRWITMLRHNKCRNDGRRSKGWKMGSTEKAVKKSEPKWRWEGREQEGSLPKPSWRNWAGEQTLMWRRCSLQHWEHRSFLLETHNYCSAHRNHCSRKGQLRALLQSALDSSSAGAATTASSCKIETEAPWILSRIKAKPQFM